ncbi:hypothetical protein [Lactobacillus helveticus]|uniref:hypothetical protein n=1 Tax=Lactobacillus helveticus TaxID=1587 RepID=UPI00218231B1|nr:hypothetical protein [Lactobacillus helveticus]
MNKIDELIKHVKEADAIIVGAGSGMSTMRRNGFLVFCRSPIYEAYEAFLIAFILVLILKRNTGLLCLNH